MLGINIVYNKIRTFFLMIYFGCFLTYFQKFPVISDKKEWRFGQSFNKLYSPKIQLDLNISFLIACTVLIFALESIHQMARFPFKKQNKTKQTNKQKSGFSREGAHPLRHPLCTPANHSLMSKPDPRLCMPIKKPISEHNE